VRESLAGAGLTVEGVELIYEAQNSIMITDNDQARKVMKLMDALDDLDDVVATHGNFDIDDAIDLED
jgi:transcriptional/translational regulatory protein YebC/TACO1